MAFAFCWKFVFSFLFKDLFVSYSGSISADAVSLDMLISDDSQYAAVARTSQKMEFSIKNFFSNQIRSFQQIWSHLLKKSLMENLIFCAVFNVF